MINTNIDPLGWNNHKIHVDQPQEDAVTPLGAKIAQVRL